MNFTLFYKVDFAAIVFEHQWYIQRIRKRVDFNFFDERKLFQK